MATITVKGNPVHISGNLPPTGSSAPDFKLTNEDLNEVSLANFAGKKKILSIVHSLETSICAASARKFNEQVAGLNNVALLNISTDLPFAASRFCESNGLKNIVTLSTFRAPEFGKAYGVTITEGPLAGLTCRAIVVLDEQDKVLHTELVPEIAQEPKYDAALAAVQ